MRDARRAKRPLRSQVHGEGACTSPNGYVDFGDLYAQENVRRGLVAGAKTAGYQAAIDDVAGTPIGAAGARSRNTSQTIPQIGRAHV